NAATERGEAVIHCRGRAGGAVRGRNDRKRRSVGTKADFLPLKVARPGAVTRGESVRRRGTRKCWIIGVLCPVHASEPQCKQQCHHPIEEPAVAAMPGHRAERIAE